MWRALESRGSDVRYDDTHARTHSNIFSNLYAGVRSSMNDLGALFAAEASTNAVRKFTHRLAFSGSWVAPCARNSIVFFLSVLRFI